MKWSRTAKNVSRLRRDFRKLLTDDLRRFDHGHALLDAFLDGAGLEPAVRVRPELFRPDVAQTLANPLRGHVDRLRLVRVHVDDPDRNPFTKELAIGIVDVHAHETETVEVAAAGIRRGLRYVSAEKLWPHPDCGLKTRTVEECVEKCVAVVEATKLVRKELAKVPA